MPNRSKAGRPKKKENEKNITKTYSFRPVYAEWLSNLPDRHEKPAIYLSGLIDKDPDFQDNIKKKRADT